MGERKRSFAFLKSKSKSFRHRSCHRCRNIDRSRPPRGERVLSRPIDPRFDHRFVRNLRSSEKRRRVRFADSRGRTTMIERHRTANTLPGSNRNRFAGKGNARSARALAITEIERRRATRFAFRADNVPLVPSVGHVRQRATVASCRTKKKKIPGAYPNQRTAATGNYGQRSAKFQFLDTRIAKDRTRHGRRWERESFTDNTNERL